MATNRLSLLVRGVLFLGAAAVAAVFFINLCHLIFDCGCVSLWAGGAAHCNIQTPGPPDCPFCAHPNTAYGALIGTIAVQGGVFLVPGRWTTPTRTLLALAAFPAVVGGVGVAVGLLRGYWG